MVAEVEDWICSRCGTGGATPLGVTRIDARYTVGYCNICSVAEPAKPRKGPRPTHDLVRGDAWQPELFVERTERAKLAKLIRKFAAGKDKIQMTDREVWLLVSLWDHWRPAGFEPTQSLRTAAAAYEAANQPKKPHGNKRSRGA